MIYIIDDFFDDSYYNYIAKQLRESQDIEVDTGHKKFYVQSADRTFTRLVCERLSKEENKIIQPILSFFRCATDELDTDWRIHSDYIIEGVNPDRACVYFMSESESSELNGTAFWEHEHYGNKLPDGSTIDEFNNIILKDSEDLTKWKLKTVIGGQENRLISYPASYFHSKYPNRAWKEGRRVFVMFYKTIDK